MRSELSNQNRALSHLHAQTQLEPGFYGSIFFHKFAYVYSVGCLVTTDCTVNAQNWPLILSSFLISYKKFPVYCDTCNFDTFLALVWLTQCINITMTLKSQNLKDKFSLLKPSKYMYDSKVNYQMYISALRLKKRSVINGFHVSIWKTYGRLFQICTMSWKEC